MNEPIIKMLQTIAQTLYDKKGENILAIDVRGISTLTDFFIIAEGAVDRHLQALARDIVDIMKEQGYDVLHVEGEKSGDWIAIDCGEFMIHLLTPEMRERYSIEEIWHKGKLVELNIKKPK